MSILRRRTRGRRGAAVIEVALVAPVFFLMVFAMLEMVRMGMVYQMMTNATREACRFAVVPGPANEDTNQVKQKLLNALANTGIDVAQYGTITIETPSNKALKDVSFGAPITVSASIPFNKASWLPGTGLVTSTLAITTSATMGCERPNP